MNNKDIDAQFLCKDCTRYNLCEYYHRRRKESYICKYFHLSVTPQEPIIDKIRAEIDNALSDGMVHKKTVLGIIDKYKAESEDKEAADENM